MQTIEKKKLSLDMRLLAYPAVATAATMFSVQDAEATEIITNFDITSTPFVDGSDPDDPVLHALAVDVDGGMAYDVAMEKADDPDWSPDGIDMALFSFTTMNSGKFSLIDDPNVESKTFWAIAASDSVVTKDDGDEKRFLAPNLGTGHAIGDDEIFGNKLAFFTQQLNLIDEPDAEFLADKALAAEDKSAAGFMLPGETGFLGFRFEDADDAVLNAYARVIPNTDGSITLKQTGYDDAGGLVTPIPAPVPLALMALGAAGIAGVRRRQKK